MVDEEERRYRDRIRRLKAALERDLLALQAARMCNDSRETKRLTGDVRNRRANLYELLAQGPRTAPVAPLPFLEESVDDTPFP